jgi:predicted permease
VITQSLGIAAVAGVGAVAYGVLLRPLPYPDPSQLVAVEHSAPGLGLARAGLSDGLYLEYGRTGVFAAVGMYQENDGVALTDRDDPIRLRVATVTPSTLLMLGAKPAAGRLFSAADGAPGAPSLVLISHALWTNRYGADPRIIGRTLELNRKAFLVVGVMPRGFAFPHPATSVWYNQDVDPSQSGVRGFYARGIARLPPGTSAAAAEASMATAIAGAVGRYPDATEAMLREARIQPFVMPLGAAMVRDVRRPLLLIAMTGLLVLVIAWANLANLVLIRAERQRRDVALGRALGATGIGVVGRLLAELGIIGMIAAAVALGLSVAGLSIHFGFDPEQVPRLSTVRPDEVLIGLVAGLSIGFTISLAAVAMSRLAGSALLPSLYGVSARITDSRRLRNTQRVMVGAQIALVATLLIAALMMVSTLSRLSAVKLGFKPDRQVTLGLDLPYWPYPSYLAGARFYLTLLERLRAIPGVRTAEAASVLPLTDESAAPLDREGVEADGGFARQDGVAPLAAVNLVTPGYFGAMGIPLIRGRRFAAGDLGDSVPSVILSAELAGKLFPDADPVGRRVRFALGTRPWHRIVGVVGDVPGRSIPDGAAPLLYLPVLDDPGRSRDASIQSPVYPGYMTVVVGTDRTASDLLPALRAAVHDVDPKVPLARVGTLRFQVDASMARLRLTMRLLVIAAAAALVLGLVGVYGVVAFAVSQRTREFGLRLAIGASPADLVRMVVGQGISGSVIGLGVGLLGGMAFSRVLRRMLEGVSPTSMAAYVTVAGLLLFAAAAASYLPARRASRIDPATVLKSD